MTEELKPCPRCGHGKPEIHYRTIYLSCGPDCCGADYYEHYVSCGSMDCDFDVDTEERTEEHAIQSWNLQVSDWEKA